MRIGILANCQHAGLAVAMRALVPEAEVIDFHWGHALNAPTEEPRMASALAKCDHVLAQSVPPQLTRLNISTLRRTIPDLFAIPSIHFAGFHPDMIIVREGDSNMTGPTTSYHSRLAIIGYLAGLNVRDTAALYHKLAFARLGYLRVYDEQAVLLREELERYGLAGQSLLAGWRRLGCFMHSFTHPVIGVLLDIARVACERFGIEPVAGVTATDLPDALADDALHPVFPDIAAAAGVAPSGMFRDAMPPGATLPPLTLEQFIAESFRTYNRASIGALRAADGVTAGLAALGLAERPPPRRTRAVERGEAFGLLTWHGTLLREGAPGGPALHLPPQVPLEERKPLLLRWPEAGPTVGFPSPAAGGVEVRGGGIEGTLALWRDGRALQPQPQGFSADFIAGGVGGWETMLPLSMSDMSLLCTLVARDWVISGTGGRVIRAEISLAAGFELHFGAWRVDLVADFPVWDATSTDSAPAIRLLLDGETKLACAASVEPGPVPLELGQQIVTDDEMALVHLPLMLSRADRQWIYEAYAGPPPVPGGWLRYGAMLSRGAGVTLAFDAAGAVHPAAEDPAVGEWTAIAEPALLAAAPGRSPLVAWIDAAVRLFVLARHVEPRAVLLLPPRAVDGGVFAVWEAVGVARPAVVPPGPLCIAADLTWLEQEHMALLPPTLLRAFRDRARPPPGRRVAPARLFVHGLGETAPAELLQAAEAEGYRPLDLRDLAPRDVLAAFAGAAAIAGASGPDLDGIIFCAPGTKVLEIAPADRFLPFAWMISEKIGLLHAVLPGGAPARFARLASMLRNWEP